MKRDSPLAAVTSVKCPGPAACGWAWSGAAGRQPPRASARASSNPWSPIPGLKPRSVRTKPTFVGWAATAALQGVKAGQGLPRGCCAAETGVGLVQFVEGAGVRRVLPDHSLQDAISFLQIAGRAAPGEGEGERQQRLLVARVDAQSLV